MNTLSWIVGKLQTYLVKDGCELNCNAIKTDENTQKLLFQDSFGYQYELTLTCKGRITSEIEGLDDIDKICSFVVQSRDFQKIR